PLHGAGPQVRPLLGRRLVRETAWTRGGRLASVRRRRLVADADRGVADLDRGRLDGAIGLTRPDDGDGQVVLQVARAARDLARDLHGGVECDFDVAVGIGHGERARGQACNGAGGDGAGARRWCWSSGARTDAPGSASAAETSRHVAAARGRGLARGVRAYVVVLRPTLVRIPSPANAAR